MHKHNQPVQPLERMSLIELRSRLREINILHRGEFVEKQAKIEALRHDLHEHGLTVTLDDRLNEYTIADMLED